MADTKHDKGQTTPLSFEGTSLPALTAAERKSEIVDFTSAPKPSETGPALARTPLATTASSLRTPGVRDSFIEENLQQVLNRAVASCNREPDENVLRAMREIMKERAGLLASLNSCFKDLYGQVHGSGEELDAAVSLKFQLLSALQGNTVVGSKRFVQKALESHPEIQKALRLPEELAGRVDTDSWRLPTFFRPQSIFELRNGDVLHTRYERMKILGFDRDMAVVCSLSDSSPIPKEARINPKTVINSGAILWAERGDEIGLVPSILQQPTTRNIPFQEIQRGSFLTFDNYQTFSTEEFLSIASGDHGGLSVHSLRRWSGEHVGAEREDLLKRDLPAEQQILAVPQFTDFTPAIEVDPEPEIRCDYATAATSLRNRLLGYNAAAEQQETARGQIVRIPKFLQELGAGDVLEFKDHRKAITIERDGLRATFLYQDQGSYHTETALLTSLDETKIIGKRVSPEPVLLTGLLTPSPLASPKWETIQQGALIYHGDGRREEILQISQDPKRDPQCKFVSSLIHYSDGTVEFLENQARNNTYFLGTPPPIVWQRSLLSEYTPQQPKTPVTTTPGKFSEGSIQLNRIMDKVEVRLAAAAGELSDAITNENYCQAISSQGESPEEYIQSVPLEKTFEALKEVHLARNQMNDAVNRTASLCLLGDAPEPSMRFLQKQLSIILGGESLLASSFDPAGKTIDYGCISESLSARLDNLWNTLTQHYAKYGASSVPDELSEIFTRASERLTEAIRTAEEILSIEPPSPTNLDSSIRRPQFVTQHYDSHHLPSPETLKLIEEAVTASRTDEDSEDIQNLSEEEKNRYEKAKHKGIVVHHYYTAENLQQMIDDGFQLVTQWTFQPGSTSKPKIDGFILFKCEKTDDPELKDNAFVDITFVTPDAPMGTVQRILDRKTIELQRTDVQGSYGEIMSQNSPSFGVFMKNGGMTMESKISHSVSPGGRITRWHPAWIPEHPAARAIYMPYQQKIARALQKEFKSQMHKEPSPVDIAPAMSERELQQVEELVDQCRDTVQNPVFTRISFGAGNCSAEEVRELCTILEDGCKGLGGVLLHAPTLMLNQNSDGTVTPKPKAGLAQSVETIQENMADDGVLCGINIHNTETPAEEITVEELNDGKPIRVIEPEPGLDYITVEDYTVKHRMHFDATDGEAISFWDMEAIRGHQIGQYFAHDTRDENPRHFKNVTIFGAGGGTIGREIKMLANHAAEPTFCSSQRQQSAGELVDPADQQHLILIDGRSEELRQEQALQDELPDEDRTVRQRSSTEKYIDDLEWREHHEAIATKQNRPEYIHVVKNADELQQVLNELGAIGDRKIIRPRKWRVAKNPKEETV